MEDHCVDIVSGNWRITFRFDGESTNVDLVWEIRLGRAGALIYEKG